MSEAELTAQVRAGDPDRWLSSRLIGDRRARADVIAVYAFEAELAAIAHRVSQPLLAEMRLTWWAEHLPGVFSGTPRIGHPVLEALAGAVARHGLPQAPFDALIDARIALAQGQPADPHALYGGAMDLAARILSPGVSREHTAAAGRAWVLSRSGASASDIAAALDEANRQIAALPVAAFPAVAHVALTRSPRRGPLSSRARVLWAALRGRL